MSKSSNATSTSTAFCFRWRVGPRKFCVEVSQLVLCAENMRFQIVIESHKLVWRGWKYREFKTSCFADCCCYYCHEIVFIFCVTPCEIRAHWGLVSVYTRDQYHNQSTTANQSYRAEVTPKMFPLSWMRIQHIIYKSQMCFLKGVEQVVYEQHEVHCSIIFRNVFLIQANRRFRAIAYSDSW